VHDPLDEMHLVLPLEGRRGAIRVHGDRKLFVLLSHGLLPRRRDGRQAYPPGNRRSPDDEANVIIAKDAACDKSIGVKEL
jgi:hypothetical protein